MSICVRLNSIRTRRTGKRIVAEGIGQQIKDYDVKNAQTNGVTGKTWVLESADQIQLDAPPVEATTAEEINHLMQMAEESDAAALQQITYWNAGPPSYRWNQLSMNELIQRALTAHTSYRGLRIGKVLRFLSHIIDKDGLLGPCGFGHACVQSPIHSALRSA